MLVEVDVLLDSDGVLDDGDGDFLWRWRRALLANGAFFGPPA